MAYLKRMIQMRRTELEAGRLNKAKMIHGFCHLYDGHESIAEGMEAVLTYDDCIITAYRDHCQAIARSDTPYRVIAEMVQKRTGSSCGKRGSMHYYNAKYNFYGGNGIVGAQVAHSKSKTAEQAAGGWTGLVKRSHEVKNRILLNKIDILK